MVRAGIFCLSEKHARSLLEKVLAGGFSSVCGVDFELRIDFMRGVSRYSLRVEIIVAPMASKAMMLKGKNDNSSTIFNLKKILVQNYSNFDEKF